MRYHPQSQYTHASAGYSPAKLGYISCVAEIKIEQSDIAHVGG
jgi:hypothetical protein